MIEKGSWTLKDRLVAYNAEVLALSAKPCSTSLGASAIPPLSSGAFWWNGISVEETSFLEEIGGNILDYTVIGDRLLVLVKPYLLSNAMDLLKGHNPMGITLYIFSTKGR